MVTRKELPPTKYPRDTYCFYIVLGSGTEVRWTNLTELQASRMQKIAELHTPDNVKAFGWGRMPQQQQVEPQHAKSSH